jgi:hypothetical protein
MDLERHLRMTNEMYRFLFETDAKTAHIPRPPKNPKRIEVKVPVPGEAIEVTVVMRQCGGCGMVSGIEDGARANCPYCGSCGKLVVMEGE